MWVRIMEPTVESVTEVPWLLAPGNTFQKRRVSSPAIESSQLYQDESGNLQRSAERLSFLSPLHPRCGRASPRADTPERCAKRTLIATPEHTALVQGNLGLSATGNWYYEHVTVPAAGNNHAINTLRKPGYKEYMQHATLAQGAISDEISALRSDQRADQEIGIIDRRANQK